MEAIKSPKRPRESSGEEGMSPKLTKSVLERVLEIGHDVDWWITEKPGEATSFETGDKITEETVYPPMKLLVPIRRYGDLETTLEIVEPTTLPGILERVWRFYNTDPVAPEDRFDEEDEDEDGDAYGKDAKCYLDFLTSRRQQGRGSGDKEGSAWDTDAPGRHPFMCSGLIRFEGLRLVDEDDVEKGYVLSLGS
jgi:hypothetical protein